MTKPITIRHLTIGEGIPKICVPIVGKTEKEILEQCKMAKDAKADLIEWRADFYGNLSQYEDLKPIKSQIKEIIGEIPLLFTIRTKEEGGNIAITKELYQEINLYAAKEKIADLIDIEVCHMSENVNEFVKKIQKEECLVIGSNHDFIKTADEEKLNLRLQEIESSGVDLVKMAVMPQNTADLLRLLQVTKAFSQKSEKPLVTMSMGEIGAMSRMTGEIFGSAITFATAGKASAPGQIPIEELRNILQIVHQKNS